MSLQIKFIAVFALLGLAVSLTFGLMSGNSLTHVLVTALICTVLSAALGVGVYQVLKNRVPEFLDLLSGSGDASDLAEDEGRLFTVSFYLADDTILIYELPTRNTSSCSASASLGISRSGTSKTDNVPSSSSSSAVEGGKPLSNSGVMLS